MQPRTPTRKVTGRVNDHGAAAMTVTVVAAPGYHPKQIDGQLSLSAPDTRSHRTFDTAVHPCAGNRTLTLDHGSVYRHRDTAPHQRPNGRSVARVS